MRKTVANEMNKHIETKLTSCMRAAQQFTGDVCSFNDRLIVTPQASQVWSGGNPA